MTDARRPSSLRQRILLGMLAYLVLLTLVVLAYGVVTHERAERLVLRTLLDSELTGVLEQQAANPGYRWHDTTMTRLYDDSPGRSVPQVLRSRGPGLHDDVALDGSIVAALVREVDGHPVAVTVDITEFERHEGRIATTVALTAIGLVMVLVLAVAWSVDRLLRPLREVAGQIAALRPDRAGTAVQLPATASAELVVIADALNDYLGRNAEFVDRERTFIDSSSHELRTPIAVIAGAADIALAEPGTPDTVRVKLQRIQRTARDVEQLISLLLVLAKDPAQLAKVSDRFELRQLLPEIVDDHRHLLAGKELTVDVDAQAPGELLAPVAIVQAAIGNLLRNAIENSDRGRISVRLQAPCTVVIQDPGHGMAPEEISAIYAQRARGGGDRGGGIGLDLVSRLCEHLGWTLRISSEPGRGTSALLDLSAPASHAAC